MIMIENEGLDTPNYQQIVASNQEWVRETDRAQVLEKETAWLNADMREALGVYANNLPDVLVCSSPDNKFTELLEKRYGQDLLIPEGIDQGDIEAWSRGINRLNEIFTNIAAINIVGSIHRRDPAPGRAEFIMRLIGGIKPEYNRFWGMIVHESGYGFNPFWLSRANNSIAAIRNATGVTESSINNPNVLERYEMFRKAIFDALFIHDETQFDGLNRLIQDAHIMNKHKPITNVNELAIYIGQGVEPIDLAAKHGAGRVVGRFLIPGVVYVDGRYLGNNNAVYNFVVIHELVHAYSANKDWLGIIPKTTRMKHSGEN